jgi:hypothetical protein
MTPWERAKIWQQENSTESFEELLGWHLSCGLVFSTPQVFLLAHETHYDPETQSMNMELTPNAWFVELAAAIDHHNPVREFLRVATRPHKWALWHRRNSFHLHAYPWQKLATRVGLGAPILGGTTSVSSVAERGVI